MAWEMNPALSESFHHALLRARLGLEPGKLAGKEQVGVAACMEV